MPDHLYPDWQARAESERTARLEAERQRDAYRALLVTRFTDGPGTATHVLLPYRPTGYPGGWWNGVQRGYSFPSECQAIEALNEAAGLATEPERS